MVRKPYPNGIEWPYFSYAIYRSWQVSELLIIQRDISEDLEVYFDKCNGKPSLFFTTGGKAYSEWEIDDIGFAWLCHIHLFGGIWLVLP